MTIIAFNFTKMSAEKKKPVKGQVNISNNVGIKDVSESKLSLDAKKKALKFEFEYVSKYDADIGSIQLSGDTIYLVEIKAADEILASWKKDKKVPEKVMRELMNRILAKCNVQAVVLSRDINLPAPIPLPKMK
ncbi:hypothetical protein H8D36_04330 [archaeon]|nr:hypothetical protein [archaeon]MBL7057376.1 hypothetical protein [Candidatus Woesearchaeota archaeon]